MYSDCDDDLALEIALALNDQQRRDVGHFDWPQKRQVHFDTDELYHRRKYVVGDQLAVLRALGGLTLTMSSARTQAGEPTGSRVLARAAN